MTSPLDSQTAPNATSSASAVSSRPAKRQKLQAVRGTNDILPGESERWQALETCFRRNTALFGYSEIRTPVMEMTELFARGIGETTDVVSKEMYTFASMGGESLTLRPEATAGLIRAAIEHTLIKKNPVVRLWTMGAMFRQERPQKGRYRQFHQFDVELLGSAQPEADVEVIVLARQTLCDLGLREGDSFALQINTLGNQASRDAYRAALLAYFRPHAAALSPDSQSRLERNPLRILDSKHPDDAPLVANAPSLLDSLDAESRAYFEAVKALLTALDVPFEVNPRLVRGLDYYCHTAFEFVTTKLGSQNAIGGGGRYDGLFEELGGKPTPGIGFALGIERLLLLLDIETSASARATQPEVYVIGMDDDAAAAADDADSTNRSHRSNRTAALRLAHNLRGAGVRTATDVLGRSFKAQMRDADRTGAGVVMIIGDDESARGLVTVKNMKDGSQQQCGIGDIPALLNVVAAAQGDA
jgi:histidyl-tRNA synthetase